MSYLSIHKALTQSLIDLSLGVPISYENSDFNPNDDVPGDNYLRVFLIPAGQDSLTKHELDEVRGIYQVSVYTKSNTSVGGALAIIDSLKGEYLHNNTYTNGDQNVVIVNFDSNVGRNDNGWYVVDCSINFKSDLQRF